METTYVFSANNKEKQYGFGSEQEAQTYLNYLNAGLEVNLYEMSISDLTEDENENLAINLADCWEEFN